MRIKIQNFQKHKEFNLNIDHPITLIVGETNAGKSAILRAIKWLVTNRPLGDAFRRKGGREVKVEIEVGGNQRNSFSGYLPDKVIRLKSKGRNEYWLNDIKFEAVGTDVPKEIQEVLNLNPEVNFQDQFDAPFLLSKTSWERTQFLWELTGQELIHRMIAEVNKRLQECKREREMLTKEIEECRGILKKVNKRFLRRLRKLVEMGKTLNEVKEELQILTERMAYLNAVSVDLKFLAEFENWCLKALEWSNLRTDLQELEESKSILSFSYPDVSKLKEKVNSWLNLKNEIFDLKGSFSVLQEVEKDLVKLEEKLNEEKGRLKQILKEMKICPLCGKEVDDEISINFGLAHWS